MRLQEILAHATERLVVAGIETARLDAEVLLAHVLGCERVELYMGMDERSSASSPSGRSPQVTARGSLLLRPARHQNHRCAGLTSARGGAAVAPSSIPTRRQLTTYESLLQRRGRHEPVAYLTGIKEFWSIPIKVTPAALIPRPETEHLVEAALEKIPANAAWHVLDLGTGSGAIAAALAKERPHLILTVTDSSSAALAVARENLAFAGKRVTFLSGDLWQPLAGQTFDLIVSNPPYIPKREQPNLPRDVRDYEPAEALFTEDDEGLAFHQAIVKNAPRHLKERGWLILECGVGQFSHLQAKMESDFEQVTVRCDLQGIERVAMGKKR